jgi:SAM-dependent methyltransferase
LRQAAIPVSAPLRHCSNLLLERQGGQSAPSGLVAGCGNGDEVVHLAGIFPTASVLGFDIEDRFSSRSRLQGGLLLADIKRLPFGNGHFDFVVAIHSIEHVGDPRVALAEVARVLRPGGWFYVGVPNRTRLLGYLGSFDATLSQKIAWNFIDYSNRIRGRFKNELGAHAGFAREELGRLLATHFETVELLTEKYLRFKYGGRIPQWLLSFLLAPRLADYSAPSHYALCRKKI